MTVWRHRQQYQAHPWQKTGSFQGVPRPDERHAGSNKPAIPQTYRTICAHYDVIVDKEVQGTGDIDKMAGRPDVGRAGLGISGGVVVRDHQSARIQLERAAHGPAQRQDRRAAMDPFVKVLSDEQAFGGEVEHRHAFLAAVAETADEVLAQARVAGLGRFSDHRLARGEERQFSGCGDGCGQQLEPRRRNADGFGQAGGGRGMDAPQRAEALDQTAGNLLRALARERSQDLRQDG